MSGVLRVACTCLLAGVLTGAWGQSGIYVCVDGKGRRLTSDRPIAECSDREQKQLNASGTVRRIVPPVPTAAERAVQEEADRKASEERLRQAEQKRMDKLLVARYPHQAAHDADRAKALQQVQEAVGSSHRRIAELREQRQKLDQEAQPYQNRPQEKWPPQLRRQLEDNDRQVAAQQLSIAAQEDEKRRISGRYDEELARLKRLWLPAQTAATEAQPVRR